MFRANTIRFLDKTLATKHLPPKMTKNMIPKNDPKYDPKIDPKIKLKNDPPKRSPLIHAHKAQDRAEIRARVGQ